MFYYLFHQLTDTWFGFNIFRYITFRMAMASVTAFLISILIGPHLIRYLSRFSPSAFEGDARTERLPDFYKDKSGIPSMGGVIIITAVVTSTLLWAQFLTEYVICAMVAMAWLGFIGFIDDYLKASQKNAKGVSARTKLIGQLTFAFLLSAYLFKYPGWDPVLRFPFFKNAVFTIGALYIVVITCVIVGSSNAVNLTDGLDGLAIGCSTMVALAFSIISYASSHIRIANYLQIPYIPQAGELAIFCAALTGATLGFLWFNAHPAEIFMGDTGALSVGGVIGVLSILLHQEALLFIAGGIFVIETLSVLIQVLYYKRTKKRFFLMSPLHHHYQIKGLKESKITIRFWIMGIIFAILAIVSLKVR